MTTPDTDWQDGAEALHTPTPWHRQTNVIQIGDAFVTVPSVEDAERIVHCVNMHDELVEALEDALFMLLSPSEILNKCEMTQSLKALLARARAQGGTP